MIHLKITILGSEGSEIQFSILSRSHPECRDYWDGNWLACNIKLCVSGVNTLFSANLRTDEFKSFLDGLIALASYQSNSTGLYSMEPYVDLTCKVKAPGKLEWSGHVYSRSDTFELYFTSDQSLLPQIIKELEDLLSVFPVIGEPDE